MMLRSVRAAPATVNLTRRIEGLGGSFREPYGGALPTRIDIFFQRIDAMDELVKSLENRITRDFAYLIGGGTVISLIWLVCFSMTHPDLEYDKLPSIAYFPSVWNSLCCRIRCTGVIFVPSGFFYHSKYRKMEVLL
jgi:hypothetical protein